MGVGELMRVFLGLDDDGGDRGLGLSLCVVVVRDGDGGGSG